MINYKKKYELEKRRNNLLFVALIFLVIGLLFLSVKLHYKTTESEDLCYLNNNLIDLVNGFVEIFPEDFEKISYLYCDSGDAERRLE